MNDSWKETIGVIGTAIAIIATCCVVALWCSGCAYKGGKVVDGTNLVIGMHVPGTDWDISVLDYVGGVRVAGNDATIITVSNEVSETNSYFGCIDIKRHSVMTATIEPVETGAVSTNMNENAFQ